MMGVENLGLCKPLTRFQRRRDDDEDPDEDDEVCFLGVVPAPAAVLPPVIRKSKVPALPTRKTKKMKRRQALVEAAKRARLGKLKGLKAGGGTGRDKCKTLSRPTDKTTTGTSGTGVSTGVTGGTQVEKVTLTRSFRRYTCVTSSKRRKRIPTQKIQPLTLLPRHRQTEINPTTPLELVPLKKKKPKKVSKAEINSIPRRRTRISLKKLEDRYSHRRRKLKSPILESVDTSTYSTLNEDGHGRRRLSAPVPTLIPPSSAPPEQLPISHSDHAIAAAQSTSAAPTLPVSETRAVENAPFVGDVRNAFYCRGCFSAGPGHEPQLSNSCGIHCNMDKLSVKFLGLTYLLPNQLPATEDLVEVDGQQFWLVPNTTFTVAPVLCSENKKAPEEPPVEIEQQRPESESDSSEDDVVELPVPGPTTTTTTSSSNFSNSYLLPNQLPGAGDLVEIDGQQFWLVPNTTSTVAPVHCLTNKKASEEPPVEIEQQPPESESDSSESSEDDVVELPVPGPTTTTTTSSSNFSNSYLLPKQLPGAGDLVEIDGQQFWLVPNTHFTVVPVRCSANTKEPPVEIEQQPPESESDSSEDDVVELPVPGPTTTTTSSSNFSNSSYNEVRCLNCEMIVPATSMSIVEHTRKHHIRRGQKECPICKKKYSAKFYLLDHIKTHYQQLQEVCGQCGAGFASTFRLNRHIQTTHRYSTQCHRPAPTKPEDFQVQPSSEFNE